MLAAVLAASLALAMPGATTADGATLVQLTPQASCRDASTLVRAGARVIAPELRLYRLARPAPLLISRLRERGSLGLLEADRPAGRLTAAAVDDPLVAEEWWRESVGIQGLTAPGPGKPVTVVDSGISAAHPEFAGRPNLELLNPQEPAPLGGEHGTMVASLVGAPVNGVGIVGIYPEALIRSWDAALGEGRQLATSDIVAGIVDATRRGPGVINLSLGGPDRDSLIEQAVALAVRSGSLVVAAAGNEGGDGTPAGYPAALPHVLTVGATGRNGGVAGFSTPSRFVDLAAPGADMLVASAQSNAWRNGVSGTSFSAPLVSGAAAWVWTVRPELDSSQLFEVLRRSARDVAPAGKDVQSGFGALDVGRALGWPAPIRDPAEPNDDLEFVRPQGVFAGSVAPLTMPSRVRASLAARLDSVEDPRDVYRVWLPARRAVRVTIRSQADVDVAVWSSGAVTVEQPAGRARLAVSARRGTGNEGLVVKAAARGRWAYVAVSARGVPDAEYRLSVAG